MTRGVQFLVDSQEPDGTWEEPEFTVTGLPRAFYLRNLYYPIYFPLLALSRWAVTASAPLARAAAPPIRLVDADEADESMASFVRRRLGREVFDRLVEPLISAVYAADMEKLSLLATLPRFRDMERQHGSLIRGMLAAKRARSKGPSAKGPSAKGASAKAPQANGRGPAPNQRPPSAFVSYKPGMEWLVESLVADLDGDLRLNTAVSSITRSTDGSYALELSEGTLSAAAELANWAP